MSSQCVDVDGMNTRGYSSSYNGDGDGTHRECLHLKQGCGDDDASTTAVHLCSTTLARSITIGLDKKLTHRSINVFPTRL